MKSSYKKGETDNDRKKYVFFSDPDVIVKRVETSIAAAHSGQTAEAKQQQDSTKHISTEKPIDLPIHFDLKNLESLLSYHPVQTYPFTFISAVKRKLALSDCPDECKKAYNPYQTSEGVSNPVALKPNTNRNLYQAVHKMDFIRPLKVPDLKISPKAIDYSIRETAMAKELTSSKFETASKELMHERGDKPAKNFERVQRKLDFSSSEGPSIINSESIEPLKAPNVSITSNLSKKKEHIRESSKEKENKSKRIKKDDSSYPKKDEGMHDFVKRSKSPRRVSRKDTAANASGIACVAKIKNNKLPFHMPRESDFASTKPKTKNFATSTIKKDSDKRHRSLGTQSAKIARDNSLDSRSRTCSNESLSEHSMKLPERFIARDTSRNMLYDNMDYKYKDDFHLLRQVEDQQSKSGVESRQMKQTKSLSQPQGKISAVFKESSKKVSEKTKFSTMKAEGKHYATNSEISEDIETVSDSNISSKNRSNTSAVSSQQSRSKDPEKSTHSIQNSIRSNKITDDSKNGDNSLPQCSNTSTSTDTKKDEESFSQIVTTTTKQTSTNNDSNELDSSSLSEALLDPRRISFRDESRSPQEEFCDLVTPDINLMFRHKRRKQIAQNSDLETDARGPIYKPMAKSETDQKCIQLMHPTALHMQFQAELHLLDSFNESLRQVMDVENSLYIVKHEQEKDSLQKQCQAGEELKLQYPSVAIERNNTNKDIIDKVTRSDNVKNDNINERTITDPRVTNINVEAMSGQHYLINQEKEEFDNQRKIVKVAEVQTQTVNDMATQTDIRFSRYMLPDRFQEVCGITCEKGSLGESEIPQLSLDSAEQFEDLGQIEEISLPSKIRTMSEISLHETTSSIKTETGTEISISTRDVTCSFNKYLDLEIAQLIKDEKQRYDKIEMLFKSREKTLNDRTKKLVKLEEQKRALKDTGQDSRVSSVKKKQRALLLKLQQEKDEMNRLKELHKIASQERKLMLQKQRNMFNPQMSTKNILTKLKRSADSQSPRRLSGPMKGYDIRSNSSMSSLVDSDKSQHDKSQADTQLQISENDLHFSKLDLSKGDRFTNLAEESNTSLSRFEKSDDAVEGSILQEKHFTKSQKDDIKTKYELKSRKFEDKMPRADILRLKSHQFDSESKLIQGQSVNINGQYLFGKAQSIDRSQLLQPDIDKSVSEYIKSESDTLIENLSKRSKSSQAVDSHFQNMMSSRDVECTSKPSTENIETIQEQKSSVLQDYLSRTSKSSQVSEEMLQSNLRSSKRTDKSMITEKDVFRKSQHNSESKTTSKRKSSKCQKTKSASNVLTENILRSKSNSQISEEFIKHHNKRTKVEKEFTESDKNDDHSVLDKLDLNESESSLQALVKHSKAVKDKNSKLLSDIASYEGKENISTLNIPERHRGSYASSSRSEGKGAQNLSNVSTRSQISTFAVSQHNSGDNEKNYSKFVVIRSEDHDFKASKKLEQILNAREAALASRKNCVEEWMAWHARLRAEEERVARMEQAALKLVTATSNVLSQQDTTISSDTSDVEGRIELLTEKLAERRIEMSRLKKEARKQAKQKLRALEANLLNQIKRYDTTIHEMRKKLESKKRTIKDSDKLAIESQSLSDFKVPDIPLKRIQDIYKSSDLFRSRSESDLLSTKPKQKDPMKHIQPLIGESRREKNLSYKSTRSSETKNANASELLSSAKINTNRSIQSIFDECILEQIDSDKFASVSMSSTSDDCHSEKYISSKAKSYLDEVRIKSEMKHTSISSDSVSEDIQSDVSTNKTGTDVVTASEAKLSKNLSTVHSDLDRKANSDADAKHSQSRSLQSESEIEEIEESEHLKSVTERSQQHDENTNVEINSVNSDSNTLNYSRRFNLLRLDKKNLNEDIDSFENELKAFSEVMSRLSRKSDNVQKSELDTEEKSTLKDISETLSKSQITDNNNVEGIKNSENKKNVFDLAKSDSEFSQHSGHNAELKLRNDFSNDKEKLSDVISMIIPEVSLSKSNQEIDYKARSKEILNEIEKSIISEHIKISENDLNNSGILLEKDLKNHHKDSETLSNDASSLESDVKSISNIISKVTESKKDLAITVESIPEAFHNLENDEISIHTELPEDRASISFSQTTDLYLKNKSESPISRDYTSSLSNIIHEKDTQEVSEAILSNIEESLVDENIGSSERAKLLESKSRHVFDIAQDKIPRIHSTENIVSHIEYLQKQDDILSDQVSISRQINEVSVHDDKEQRLISIREQDLISEKSEKRKRDEDCYKEIIIDAAKDLILRESKDQNQSEAISTGKLSLDNEDWTVSDSFDAVENQAKQSESELLKSPSPNDDFTEDASQEIDNESEEVEEQIPSDIEDVSMFVPKGESTSIETYGIKFEDTVLDSRVAKPGDEFDDILDIIARENNQKQEKKENQEEHLRHTETETLLNVTFNSAAKVLDKIEDVMKDNLSVYKDVIQTEDSTQGSNNLRKDEHKHKITVLKDHDNICDKRVEIEEVETYTKVNEKTLNSFSQTANEATDKHVINVNVRVEIEDEDISKVAAKSREIVITELEPDSVEEKDLPELEINAKVELVEEEPIATETKNAQHEKIEDRIDIRDKESEHSSEVEIRECLELISEQDSSSEGEQLDNLVETTESRLDVVEKRKESSVTVQQTPKTRERDIKESIIESNLEVDFEANLASPEKSDVATLDISNEINVVNKTFDILKDPEYEDISEESLEVSEILDKTESRKSVNLQKCNAVPEKYEAIPKSEEVLRILDELSRKSSSDSVSNSQRTIKDSYVVKLTDDVEKVEPTGIESPKDKRDETTPLEEDHSDQITDSGKLAVEESKGFAKLDDQLSDVEDNCPLIIYGSQQRILQKHEQDVSSDSSEAGDTPRGVSEIEMDSPRDANDSRLDIDILDDDLLSDSNTRNQAIDSKNDFHTAPIVATSEKDIKAMIDKLTASLHQPGLEAELQTKRLRIEQLEIELQIKRLEAEEVSCVREIYVREIPNKPPPPYTPPGGGRLSTTLASPSPPPAVIPSNIEELTAFTEKATALIFKAKQSGEDIMSLKAPPEIYELTKDNNETVTKDSRIYNTFLFDLCKETIAEVYQSEYEKPAPSWMKTNVKTKPTMKIPKTVEELNEYVSKEVATLFGFKTKMQRENMVMRWCKKHKDRVDELLAKEAQAEEEEWTKYHQDELTIKNGFTIAILDALIMETAKVVKVAYAKKKKMMV